MAGVLLLASIGITTIRNIGGPGGTETEVPSQGASPSVAASPVGAFDPTLEGPGISAPDDASPAIFVLLACAVLVALVLTTRGWRRILPAALAAALAGWAVVGMLTPITVLVIGYAPGLNLVRAPEVPGSQEVLFYELAPASGRFSVGLMLLPGGPLPIRIEGIVSPTFGYRDDFLGMLLTAVWIDGEPNGGMSGPIRPFAPFAMSRNGQSIWLVGRAGACAIGSTFDPSNPATVGGFGSMDSPDLRVSVIGWPRTVHLQLPFRVAEPDPPSCPGPTLAPSGPTSARPSSP